MHIYEGRASQKCIMKQQKPIIIEGEIVTVEPQDVTYASPQTTAIEPVKDQRAIPAPPIHPLAAMATIALDAVWGAVDTASTATVVGVLLVPLLVVITSMMAFVSVLAVQKGVARDTWMAAFGKAVVMAILAGVPFPVMGTATGAILLGWAGLSSLTRLPSGK
jgi:hypothetical protein